MDLGWEKDISKLIQTFKINLIIKIIMIKSSWTWRTDFLNGLGAETFIGFEGVCKEFGPWVCSDEFDYSEYESAIINQLNNLPHCRLTSSVPPHVEEISKKRYRISAELEFTHKIANGRRKFFPKKFWRYWEFSAMLAHSAIWGQKYFFCSKNKKVRVTSYVKHFVDYIRNFTIGSNVVNHQNA